MNLTIKLILLFLLMQIGVSAQYNLIPKKSLQKINEEHKFLLKFSYPNPDTSIVDSLIHSDFNQFDSLVNIAFLVKYDSLYDPRFNELIQVLQAENSENKLLQSSLELSNYGNEALIALDKVTEASPSFRYWRRVVRTFVLGYEFDDFIIEVGRDFYRMDYSGKILHRSYFSLNGVLLNERTNLQSSLKQFISSSTYATYRDKFHQIVLDAYKRGVLDATYKYSFIQHIITQEVLNKEETYLNDYLTLIDEISEQEGLLLLEFVNYGRRNSYYPQLFLDLLDDENADLVSYIIEVSSGCWDEYLCPKVKTKLLQIFHGNDDSLKFKAAFALMHDYEYPLAYEYLMHEVDLNRHDRRYTAISWLGDASNYGHPMSDTLNLVLRKYLYSSDKKIQRATLETYLTYNSPNVIVAIIPFVDYELEFVSKNVVKKILTYEDRAFTIEKLQFYLATGNGSEQHKQLLEKLK